MFVLLAPAFADAEMAPCESSSVQATSPAPLATGVPVDAVPAGLVSWGGCGEVTWELDLSIPSTGVVVGSATLTAQGASILEVDPGFDLEPETTYRMAFTPISGDGVASEVAFTTGAGNTSVGLDGGPEVIGAEVSWSHNGSTVIQAELVAAPSEDGDTFIALGVDGIDGDLGVTTASGAAEVFLTGFANFAEAPDEVCVLARQRDIAGQWTESPTDCVAPDIEPVVAGCNVAPGGLTWIGGLLGLVAIARRRP